MYLVRFFFVLLLIQFVCSLNILCIFPYHGKSHFFVFKVLLNELARKGHNLTVISHFPREESSQNYKDISLAGTIKVLEDDMPVERSYITTIGTILFLTSSGRENCEVMLQNEQVQNLVKTKQKFDIILTEQFNSDCALGIAYKLEAPVVGVTSHVLMPWHYNRFGIPWNPSYVSAHFFGGGTNPTLYQRIERVIFDTLFKFLYRVITQRSDQNALTKYIGEVPDLEELSRDIKFILMYHNFVLTGSKLFPANVIEVGGYHVGNAKPLTGDLKEFIDNAEHGIIYISFGSVVKGSSLPADKLDAVLESIDELPQKFVWKWENKLLVKDKKKLYISNWLPQADILGHPKTLAFFSHAGMLGTTEAIHHGVPVVAMPVLGDQPSNAASIQESGLGVELQINDLTKENLLNAFKKVLDPKFRKNVQEISKAWRDRPNSPLDTAVYWVEFAARHPNSTFRTAAADIPLYQYFNLDVACVLFITLILIPLLIVKSVLVLCCKTKSSVKVKPKKNKIS